MEAGWTFLLAVTGVVVLPLAALGAYGAAGLDPGAGGWQRGAATLIALVLFVAGVALLCAAIGVGIVLAAGSVPIALFAAAVLGVAGWCYIEAAFAPPLT